MNQTSSMPPTLTSPRALAALRIAVGVLFIIFGEFKVFGAGFTFGGGFQQAVEAFLKGGTAYPFMLGPLREVVLPHSVLLAFVVAYGEMCIGLSLVSGILVRTAGVFGAIYMLLLIFSANYPGADVPLWRYFGTSTEHSGFLLCFITFALSDSAATWSIRRRHLTRT